MMNETVINPEVIAPTPSSNLESMVKKYPLRFYGNKSRMLHDINDLLPSKTKTVVDLFAGTGVVSWFLKQNGYRVISNDIMRYPTTRLKALVQNQSTTLSYQDLKVLSSNKKPTGEMCYLLEHYKRFMGESNCRFLEAWTNNLPRLNDPVKREIATYVVVTCIAKHLGFAGVHWSRHGLPTGNQDLFNVPLEKEVKHYSIHTFPQFLKDNGQENIVYQEDAVELLTKIEADVVYMDPPYACRGGAYEASYAFFDDLVMLLSGQADAVKDPTDSKCELQPYTFFGSRKSALMGFFKLMEKSRHIPNVIISYNDTSNISPDEIATIAEINGRSVEMKTLQLPIAKTGKNSVRITNEYLISCTSKAA